MNQLSLQRRIQIVHALCEGNGLRSTARMTGSAINTVVRILVELGAACLDYQDEVMVNLPCKRLETNEVWSFVYNKAKNVHTEHAGEVSYGDVWTWTATDAETKLIPCWRVGNRDAREAYYFMQNLASRLTYCVQLTTDVDKTYLEAIEGAYSSNIDYPRLIKKYGKPEPDRYPNRRYSPAECVEVETNVIKGTLDKALVSTSYVEHQNLTMRMSMRRFTRLTNDFSKKLENHMYALALYFLHYNFVRMHKTLSTLYPITPAMAAGLCDHIWSTEELVSLLERSK